MGALAQNTTADGSTCADRTTTAELTATCAMLMSAFDCCINGSHVENGNRSTSGIHDEELGMCRLLPVAEADNAADKAVVGVPGDA
jgi:ethanolamine ammonia-lyase large subunit